MLFRQNADVYTSEGKNVGRIDRVVLDPQTKDVSHFVVRKGFLLTEDKVVPVDLIGAATKEGITLRAEASDLEALPLFEETDYVQATEDLPSTALNNAPPLYWYPLFGNFPLFGAVADPPTPRVIETEQNISEGRVALKEGAKVIAVDGKHVGNVEQVLTDPQTDRATHLVIVHGLLVKERRGVPIHWVSEVKEDKVHLTMGSHTIEELSLIPEG